MSKTKAIVGILLVCVVGIVLRFSTPLFQEGNPLPVVGGILKLSLSKDEFVRIGEEKYLVKATPDGFKHLTDYLAQQRLQLIDRAGSGLQFKDRGGNTITATTRMYTSRFEVVDFGIQHPAGFVLP